MDNQQLEDALRVLEGDVLLHVQFTTELAKEVLALQAELWHLRRQVQRES